MLLVQSGVANMCTSTYRVSDSIIDYYYTQLIGDPSSRPVIKASASFPVNTTSAVIDGNPYGDDGGLAWTAVNVFFRQLHNLIVDTTDIPASADAVGLHWPSSQATSLSNVEFRLAEGKGTRHVGLFIEEGSGGLLSDFTFRGGDVGARLGNQQFTARNFRFYGCKTAIKQLWDWGWTYKSLFVKDCEVGVEMVDTNTASITVVDGEFVSVGDAIKTSRTANETDPEAAGTLVLENVRFKEVETVLKGPDGVVLPGDKSGEVFVRGYIDVSPWAVWGYWVDTDCAGPCLRPPRSYDLRGHQQCLLPPAQGPPRRRQVLRKVKGSPTPPSPSPTIHNTYLHPQPTYADIPASKFVSIRDFNATGDGTQDATDALNALFTHAAEKDLVAFVDAGYYPVSDTVTIPPGARVVGEALASVILGVGEAFEDMDSPRAVVRVGEEGDEGRVEWSDMIVSTRGPTAGAIAVEVNLLSPDEPSGMWDVHVRIGGFAGTEQQLKQCPTASKGETDPVRDECIVAHTSMHITRSAGGLYSENCWLWVADHDLEDPHFTQITLFAGRGLLIESEEGRVWVTASGSEHHVLYQYQLVNTKDVYLGQIQSETPYFQPNPPATEPFSPDASIQDPDFEAQCAGQDGDGDVPCEMAWGLRVIDSSNVVIFGAGLYSFFNDYSTDCAQPESGTECQERIFEVLDVGADRTAAGNRTAGMRAREECSGKGCAGGLDVYGLNTVGTVGMVTSGGEDIAFAEDNTAGFVDTVAVYHHA